MLYVVTLLPLDNPGVSPDGHEKNQDHCKVFPNDSTDGESSTKWNP